MGAGEETKEGMQGYPVKWVRGSRALLAMTLLIRQQPDVAAWLESGWTTRRPGYAQAGVQLLGTLAEVLAGLPYLGTGEALEVVMVRLPFLPDFAFVQGALYQCRGWEPGEAVQVGSHHRTSWTISLVPLAQVEDEGLEDSDLLQADPDPPRLVLVRSEEDLRMPGQWHCLRIEGLRP